MRLAAVRRYGEGVMASINAGLVDPFAMKALAGARPKNLVLRAGRGAVGGGIITDRFATSEGDAGSRLGGHVVGAVIIANEQNLERQLAAGSGAMHAWLKREAPKIQNYFRGRR